MWTIARHQLMDGLKDAKFLFLAVIVLLAFLLNGIVYSERYHLAMESWQDSLNTTNSMLSERSNNLQELANYPQSMIKPPSALLFIADGGDSRMPNAFTVNAFVCQNPRLITRGNEKMPVLMSMDWSFIVGSIMSLLAFLLGFGSVCGEKRDGTLRLVLSYPVSRLSFFIGKYLGLLATLLITLVVGALASLVILVFSGALPLTLPVVTAISWALIISAASLSFMLLLAMAVSGLVSRPSIALVMLLVIWIITVVAIPGAARLLGERMVAIPSSFEVAANMSKAEGDIWRSTPSEDQSWDRNPHSQGALGWGRAVIKILDAKQKIRAAAVQDQIRQAEYINSYRTFSPAGLLDHALKDISTTGIAGFKALNSAARRYRQQMYSFTEQRDRVDPDSPHILSSWGSSSDTGVFSTKPVGFSSVPKSESLWIAGGLPKDQPLPLWQLTVFILGNLFAATVAFIAFNRFDPR